VHTEECDYVNGLYQVQHNELNVAKVLKRVTLPTLHRCSGHMSADSIHSLIHHHTVKGMELIKDSSPFYCKLCEHVKTTCKPIKSEQTGGQAQPVHPDLCIKGSLLTVSTYVSQPSIDQLCGREDQGDKLERDWGGIRKKSWREIGGDQGDKLERDWGEGKDWGESEREIGERDWREIGETDQRDRLETD
jgi:hypothetical protein